MFAKLLALFILIPFLELIVIIQLGRYIGLGYTLAAIVILGIIGALIAKQQGLSVLWKIKGELSQGQLPAQELIDGVLILIGSALLITPGLITDALSFFFLIPATRRIIKLSIRRKLEKMIRSNGPVKFYFRRD